MDSLLDAICTSVDGTNAHITKLLESLDSEDYPEFIKQLNGGNVEEMSLLSVKNNSMASYLNNVILIVLAQLNRLKKENSDEYKDKAVDSTIEQRITLEKGVFPLEKKLNYQLDKMIRQYREQEKAFLEQEEKHPSPQTKSEGSGTSGSDSDSDSESESDDELSYKPNVSSLKSSSEKPSEATTSTSTSTYKPPKISAKAPPTESESKAKGNTKKLQSMEEYLREASDLPQEERSIGSNIISHGRGGVTTNKDREKQAEIQSYEEDNFTRLPHTMTEKSSQQKRKDANNTFAGEDWSMFNNSRNVNEVTKKRRSNNVWDKVKRRK